MVIFAISFSPHLKTQKVTFAMDEIDRNLARTTPHATRIPKMVFFAFLFFEFSTPPLTPIHRIAFLVEGGGSRRLFGPFLPSRGVKAFFWDRGVKGWSSQALPRGVKGGSFLKRLKSLKIDFKGLILAFLRFIGVMQVP